jgi:hemerythrin-like domain-containing protein
VITIQKIAPTTMTSSNETISIPIDTSDLKYQADKAFQPDKESTWKFPKENDGWVHAHNTIRGELQTIEDCLKAVQSRARTQPTLKSWEIQAIRTVFEAHCEFVHLHHENEDHIASPFLATRIKLPSKLTDDHPGIVKTMNNIEAKIKALKPGDERDASMAALLAEWKPYSATMHEHLQEEEDIGLPLQRAYFTPAEHVKMVEKLIARETKLALGNFVFHMGKDRFRKEFMKEQGIPFFVWWLSFSGALKLYETKVVTASKALMSGVEPVPLKSGGLLGC